MELGTLVKVDLREQWKKEDTDFTPWLALDKNIELLGEAIGIELEVQSQEESVGPFRADILCVDTSNDSYVLIENQLEKTDHTHLGQLMTYASGLDAVTIIWIAKKFTEEHRAALDWLNRITDASFNFFGIEIELYRIGKSKPAPMFKLVSKPNNWSKSIRKSVKSQNVTDTKLLQQEYWQNLKDYIEESNSKIRMQSPRPQHWTNLAIGKSNFHLSASVSTRDNTISIWLNIRGENAKQNYDNLLETAEQQSYSKISTELKWLRMDDKKQSAVILTTNGNMTNKKDWINQFKWFTENLELFTNFFKPLIRKM